MATKKRTPTKTELPQPSPAGAKGRCLTLGEYDAITLALEKLLGVDILLRRCLEGDEDDHGIEDEADRIYAYGLLSDTLRDARIAIDDAVHGPEERMRTPERQAARSGC